jgi:hypothetical protein
MSVFIQNLLAYIIKGLITAKLYQHIYDLVYAQFFDPANVTGDDKKRAVLKELAEATDELGAVFSKTPNAYINLAIEAIVVIIKAKLGK